MSYQESWSDHNSPVSTTALIRRRPKAVPDRFRSGPGAVLLIFLFVFSWCPFGPLKSRQQQQRVRACKNDGSYQSDWFAYAPGDFQAISHASLPCVSGADSNPLPGFLSSWLSFFLRVFRSFILFPLSIHFQKQNKTKKPENGGQFPGWFQYISRPINGTGNKKAGISFRIQKSYPERWFEIVVENSKRWDIIKYLTR